MTASRQADMLHVASAQELSAVVQLLLESGAVDPNENRQKSPLSVASAWCSV